MKVVTPERWLILKFPQDKGSCIYKVFSSWTYDDVWWLSSGANSLEDICLLGNVLIFPQASGSIYRLPIDAEGEGTLYAMTMLKRILKEKGLKLHDVIIDSAMINFKYDTITKNKYKYQLLKVRY